MTAPRASPVLPEGAARARAAPVRLIVLGSVDRGDDALGPLVVAQLPADLWPLVDVRIGGSLDVLDLADVPPNGACVVVDAARGLAPGVIAFVPFVRFLGRRAGHLPDPRSSHELPLGELIQLVHVVRGDLPRGGFLVAGGLNFGLGELPSQEIARAVPALVLALERLIGRLARPRRTGLVGRDGRWPRRRGVRRPEDPARPPVGTPA